MISTQCTTDLNTSVDKLAGHVFLAKMGKKLLRPGGRLATEELFELADLKAGERVCEIATNRAMTAMELARRFDVQVDGVDASPEFLTLAGCNIRARRLQDLIRVHLSTGHELPFSDQVFDAVMAEAVITMLPWEQKLATLSEAARVLRQGGRLVIHELAWLGEPDQTLRQKLIRTIRHPAWPLTVDEWRELAGKAGYEPAALRTGPMSLLAPGGLVRDEGVGGVARIAWNVLRTPRAGARFAEMARFFWQYRGAFQYIVLKAMKVQSNNGEGSTPRENGNPRPRIPPDCSNSD